MHIAMLAVIDVVVHSVRRWDLSTGKNGDFKYLIYRNSFLLERLMTTETV